MALGSRGRPIDLCSDLQLGANEYNVSPVKLTKRACLGAAR